MTIAGSDSGGGAGIQADLKTFQQFGVFGTSAVVAITAQNTVGVRAVHVVPEAMVREQLVALTEDLPPQAFKTGMLGTAGVVEEVVNAIRRYRWPNFVLDPVMVSTSGHRLLAPEAERVVREELVPLAQLVTPNLDEAELLVGFPVRSREAMLEAGRALLELGADAALIKGGHLLGESLVDVLVTPGEVIDFPARRILGPATHGTGCTLSAAIAAGLALGRDLLTAVDDALQYVHRAIAAAPLIGHGSMPLNHAVPAPGPTAELY
ncbi:MAG: bifunctional hydroxymethylpyrimidine kinase/phosphomethylpyrimidine kinase [Gemmatimonadota bacterium]